MNSAAICDESIPGPEPEDMLRYTGASLHAVSTFTTGRIDALMPLSDGIVLLFQPFYAR